MAMRRRHNSDGSFLGKGKLPARRSVKFLLGVIAAAGCIAAEGQALSPAAEIGVRSVRGGSGGGLRDPENGRRHVFRSWTGNEGTAGSKKRGVTVDGGRQVASSPRILEKAAMESGSDHSDDAPLVVIDGDVRDESDDEGRSPEIVIGDGEEEEEEEEEEDDKPENEGMPRILTVLTTYNKRSSFVKAYREAVGDRSDGYRPTVFVVSDQEDDDPERVIDYKVGSPRRHRTLAAIREACARYEGKFDWLALGDDDTVFMYNRLGAFLSHIDHTQPVAFGKVDGLNPTASPCYDRDCFTPEQKRNTSDLMATRGCCDDFTHPCEVPIYPEHPKVGRIYGYEDYGPGGLFWPFGGSGTLVSAGLIEDAVGGTEGWGRCALVFGRMNTDVQFAQCLKTHGYSMGSYRDGFTQMETADPVLIREALAADCQVMGVHVGIRHLADGGNYTMESFGDAVAAVREEDEAWAGTGGDLADMCPKAWEAISKWS